MSMMKNNYYIAFLQECEFRDEPRSCWVIFKFPLFSSVFSTNWTQLSASLLEMELHHVWDTYSNVRVLAWLIIILSQIRQNVMQQHLYSSHYIWDIFNLLTLLHDFFYKFHGPGHCFLMTLYYINTVLIWESQVVSAYMENSSFF
jgi:hypothetical protein